MITREKLQERVAQLKDTVEKLTQQLFIHQGALADAQSWLEEFDKPDVPETK